MKRESLAQMLRAARERRDWTLAEAADALGTTKGHLWELENEHRNQCNPRLRLVAAIVRVYCLSPDKIVQTWSEGA